MVTLFLIKHFQSRELANFPGSRFWTILRIREAFLVNYAKVSPSVAFPGWAFLAGSTGWSCLHVMRVVVMKTVFTSPSPSFLLP